jgi:hypothetical protein
MEPDPQFNFLSKLKFSSLNLINAKGYFLLIMTFPICFSFIDISSSAFMEPSITSIGSNFFESLFLSLILAVFSCQQHSLLLLEFRASNFF